MNDDRFLAGRGAVITGGGRGIGAAIATALAGAGASVVLTARSQDQLQATARAIEADGGRAIPLVCDVTAADSVESMAAAAVRELGQVDILINNAGIATSSPLHRQSLDEWERVFAVNVTGTFLCTKALVPAMGQRGWGRVINVASTAARMGARYIGAYAASKHAVLGFTRCMAAEFADRGVTVNALCPGYVDTPMTEQAVERIMSRAGMGRQEAMSAILATCPQRRLIDPREIAHAALALCHDGARGINGQAIGIDGGELLS